MEFDGHEDVLFVRIPGGGIEIGTPSSPRIVLSNGFRPAELTIEAMSRLAWQFGRGSSGYQGFSIASLPHEESEKPTYSARVELPLWWVPFDPTPAEGWPQFLDQRTTRLLFPVSLWDLRDISTSSFLESVWHVPVRDSSVWLCPSEEENFFLLFCKDSIYGESVLRSVFGGLELSLVDDTERVRQEDDQYLESASRRFRDASIWVEAVCAIVASLRLIP